MSGNHHRPERDEPEDELESLLKRLQPTPLDVDQIEGLNRDYQRVASIQANSPNRVQWKRLIPLVAGCFIIMGSIALYQVGFKFTQDAPEKSPSPVASTPSAPVQPVAPETPAAPSIPLVPFDTLSDNSLSDRFVPVSSRGYLINSSSQGVIETEHGPREKLQLEFEDTYHWRDPATGTNIRIFSPRSEELIVPLSSH